MSFPNEERALLLNRGEGSADESIRVRARVSKGRREGSESRAWRDESFEEWEAARIGGEGGSY